MGHQHAGLVLQHAVVADHLLEDVLALEERLIKLMNFFSIGNNYCLTDVGVYGRERIIQEIEVGIGVAGSGQAHLEE